MERILFLALLSGMIQAQSIWPTARNLKGRERESLSFCCNYDKDYKHDKKYWCRGETFSSCQNVVTSSDPENGRTSLRDDSSSRKFCITIKDLTVQDSGVYWCGIDVWGFDKHVSVTISVDAAARPVTPSKPSTVKLTTKPAMTITPSPSVGPAVTSAVTLESPTTPLLKNETGSKRPEGTGTLTILGISTGVLLLFLCLACVIATVWRRTGSRDELEGKGDSLKSFAEATEYTELHYAEVTANKRSQPLSDFVTYGNLCCQTIAEYRSPKGSVDYAPIKR